ncbi:hypothetical protein D3C81_1580290 [compost metagenome]
MSWKSWRNGHKPALLIINGDTAYAIGRIRQPVQQHNGALRFTFRHQHKRTIAVIGKLARPHRAVTIIAVQRRLIRFIQFVRHLRLQIVENRRFARQIITETGAINLLHRHLVRRPGMPGMQRRASFGLIDPHRQQHDQHNSQHHSGTFHQCPHTHPYPPRQISHSRLSFCKK